MALSGQVKTNAFSEEYGTVGLQFDWSATQSVESNTSTISWTLRTFGTMTSSYWYKAGPISMTMAATSGTLGGTKSYSNSSRIQLRGGTVIASGTATLTHNASGVGAFSVSLSAAIYYTSTNVTGSGTGSLTNIARATTPAFSSQSVALGSSVTVDLSSRASSAFTHTLKYTFGSATGTIATKTTGTSVAFTPPTSLGAQIQNAESGTCTITCETYNGNTMIGTKNAALTLTAPASWVPTNTTACEPSNKVLGNTVYPATVSGVKVEVTCAGSNSSTIRSVAVNFQNKTYTTQTITNGKATIITDACIESGDFTLETVVTDSRGRTKNATVTITVTAYSSPAITLELIRVSSSSGSTPSEAGSYMHIVLSGEVTDAGSNAAATATLKYQVSGGSETSLTPTKSGRLVTYTSSPNISVSSGLSCSVVATITDTAGNTTKVTKILPVGFKTMNFRAGGKGIAFGTVATEDKLVSAMDAKFKEAVSLEKTLNVSGKLTAEGDAEFDGDMEHVSGSSSMNIPSAITELWALATPTSRHGTRTTAKTVTIDITNYRSTGAAGGIWAFLLIGVSWVSSSASAAAYIVHGIQGAAQMACAQIIKESYGPSASISGTTLTITFYNTDGGGYCLIPLFGRDTNIDKGITPYS